MITFGRINLALNSAARLAALSWDPENLKKLSLNAYLQVFASKMPYLFNFRDKNAVFISFRDKNCAFELYDKNPVFGFNFVCSG